jgi:leucyl-tRNA synthetase
MYDHKKIEKKWQERWREEKIYKTGDDEARPKYYILDMFPYPSGAGLHVGHPKGYIATDIFARMKTMQGFNVLHPMGWDAFGLPAENFAIKNKIHPQISTNKNIDTFKNQLLKLGFSYDWDREINTTDPSFYKWTQWIFLQMLKKGLAYESYEPINWCPSCKTGLSNEDLEDGKCERCGSEIEKKPMRQWVLKITDYADRLLSDLDKLPHWEASIKEMQRNWIGRSEGAKVKFQIPNFTRQASTGKFQINSKLEISKGEIIEVFTTRPDTLFGATYFVMAPEHPLVEKITSTEQKGEVEDYIRSACKKSEMERTELSKEKTGVFTGAYAVNPVNGEKIPVWIADYVMMGYGTGAIMAVPAHDARDWEFALKYKLPIKEVVGQVADDRQQTTDNRKQMANDRQQITDNRQEKKREDCFVGNGVAVNSGFLDGLKTSEAKEKMIAWLKEKGLGEKAVNYKLQDWVFSRQRYWGEPIPVIHCEKCGVVGVPEDELPVRLPEVEHYEPSGTGESPLAAMTDWVNVKCPKCGGAGKRETNTMPQWAGSSWYYLRYIDPKNNEALVDKNKEKYWSPVDFYVGGAEHATRHLIYARFWHKFLFDIGAVNYDEPFTRLQHVGLIMAEDGRKMSKRWGNVINPDDIVEKYGADAMRVYEMFMGPFSQSCAWSTNGLIGARKFLERVWKLKDKTSSNENKKINNILHKTIKKVGDDIEEFKLNTAVSAMMILSNEMEKAGSIGKDQYVKFLTMLSLFAPHIAEEIYFELGFTGSIFKNAWPKFDPELAKDENITLVLQINGKVREKLEVPAGIGEEEAKKLARESEVVKKWIEGKEVLKEVYVEGKLVNIVVR